MHSDNGSASNKRDRRRASVSSYQTASTHDLIAKKTIQQRIFDQTAVPEPNVPGSVKSINDMLRLRLEYRDKQMQQQFNVARNKAIRSMTTFEESPEQKDKREQREKKLKEQSDERKYRLIEKRNKSIDRRTKVEENLKALQSEQNKRNQQLYTSLQHTGPKNTLRIATEEGSPRSNAH